MQFDPDNEEILRRIENSRDADEKRWKNTNNGNAIPSVSSIDTNFEGHGTLIVAKETVNSTEPLCMGLGNSGNKVS